MKLEEMRRNVRYAVGMYEPEELPIVDQKINEGILDVLRRTGCSVICFDADTPEADRLQLGPIMRALHVVRNGVRLERVAFPSLSRYPQGYSQVGDILIFGTAFAADEKLQIYGIPRPPPLSSPDDRLEDENFGGIQVEFQDAVELYAMAELADLASDQSTNRGANYRIQYEGQEGRSGRLAEIRREVNKMSGLTLGKATLDYRVTQVSKTLPLMKGWKGMGPDKPRDSMPENMVWRMEDLVPEDQGSKLETRQGWVTHVTSPLDGYVTAQQWVNTLGGNHHLAATNKTLYNLDVPATPRVVATMGTSGASGALWPMATLYEYVLVPRTGDQLPVVLRYAGARGDGDHTRLDAEGQGRNHLAVTLRARQHASPAELRLLPLARVGSGPDHHPDLGSPRLLGDERRRDGPRRHAQLAAPLPRGDGRAPARHQAPGREHRDPTCGWSR